MSSRCDGGWPPFPEPIGKPRTIGQALDGVVLTDVERWEGDIRRYAIGAEWKKLVWGGQSDKYFQLVRADPRQPCGALCKSSGEFPSAASITHWAEPRKFARKELARIASFPDDFRFAGEYAQVYARIGNCVPPKFAQAIATCIREHILGDREFTYLSTFAGCGGSSLGYKWAGGHGVAAVEFDDNAVETYRLNFPDTPVLHRDICTVTAQELLDLTGLQVGDLDILDGSPPCQGFSTAGKRVLTDPRNSLFREYVRLIEGLQPKVFVMENVSGMVKGKMRLIFREIMLALKATGYMVRCKLLNAMYYEVPQSRERLIWIGVRPDIGREPGFPGPVGKPTGFTPEEAGPGPWWLSEQAQAGLVAHKARHEALGNGWGYTLQSRDKPCPTVRKGGHIPSGACVVVDNGKWRLFSSVDLRRAASLPDGYALAGSWKDHFERIGNSVPPRFMYHIASHIRDHILPQDVTSHGP